MKTKCINPQSDNSLGTKAKAILRVCGCARVCVYVCVVGFDNFYQSVYNIHEISHFF